LARAYERLGKLAQAEKTYRRAIELRPHYWATYSWLGAFYYGQTRYQEAAEMFSEVISLAPDSFRGYTEKVLLVDLVEDSGNGLLDELVFQGRHGGFVMHLLNRILGCRMNFA
jgi:tetratricopeptide (TPR) repeat protein